MTGTFGNLTGSQLAEILSTFDVSKHDSLQPLVMRTSITFIVLVTIVVSLRTFTRLVLVRHFGLDDVIIVLAAGFLIALCVLPITNLKDGLGLHLWDIDKEPHANLWRVENLSVKAAVLYPCAISLAKISIIVFYLQIFPNPLFKKLMWVTLVVMVGIGICGIVLPLVNTSHSPATFINFSYASGAINILTDFILCLSPLPLFWRLNIARRDRIVICLLFATGLFASICSILRITSIHNLLSADFTYEIVEPQNWSIIEVGTAILCASIPSLKPLALRLFPASFRTYIKTRGGQQTSPTSHRNKGSKLTGGSGLSSHGGRTATQISERGVPLSDKDKHISAFEMVSTLRSTDSDTGPILGNQGYVVHVSTGNGSEEENDTDEERNMDLSRASPPRNGVGVHRSYTVDRLERVSREEKTDDMV